MSDATTGGAATAAAVDAALLYPEPTRRDLRIFALDPMVSRLALDPVVTLSVPYEPLAPGPSGFLVRVVDYDSARGVYYAPVDLEDPRLVLQDGLAPSEQDPRFHQQMVYAVTSALLESFERSLGRRFRWRGEDLPVLLPHAFVGANARFDQSKNGSVAFGYFTADEDNPGRNLPGQTVFSCLSHDVIVHEVTHALVHRQREKYLMPTNPDVYAFHEGFADLLALFQHFTLPALLEDFLATSRGDISQRDPFVSLAQQFGEGSGRGQALRSALDSEALPTQLSRTFEPHQRGAVLVAGVFDAFFTTYRRATADILRIATGGTGILPPGAIHPDVIRRVAEAARRIAARFMRMCIRAFVYLPPVDVTFGDFIRAVVSADRDVDPFDEFGARGALVEGCRLRGIYPSDTGSLVVDAIAYPDVSTRGCADLPSDIAEALLLEEALLFTRRRDRVRGLQTTVLKSQPAVASAIGAWARKNRGPLDLHPDLDIEVAGFHASFRPTAAGIVHVDVVVQLVQSEQDLTTKHRARLGGIPLRGGTTVVADASGRVRAVVSKPVPVDGGHGTLAEQGHLALERTFTFVDEFDGHYATSPGVNRDERVRRTLTFAAVDGAA